MRCFWAMIKKELFNYLINPAFYLAAILFCALPAASFFLLNNFFVIGKGSSDLRLFFSYFPYVSIIVIPVLTMLLWSEERTAMQVVSFMPISSVQLVVSKWLSSLISFVFILLPTLLVPLVVSKYGIVDYNLLVTAYLMMTLFACASLACGQFFAILTKSTSSAFILTVCVLGTFTAIHLLRSYLVIPNFLSSIIQFLSFFWHFDAAEKGIIDSRDIVFYVALTIGFLLSCSYILERRKSR